MDIQQALLIAMWVWFGGWATALAVVDIREHRLPNRMVGACLVGTIAFAGALAWSTADPWLLVQAGAASLAAVVVFGVGHVIGGMGMGDVKYAAVTGLALGTIGWAAVWWGHLLGFMLAGVVVVFGLLTGKLHRRSAVPFGPFMAAGAGIVGLTSVVPIA